MSKKTKVVDTIHAGGGIYIDTAPAPKAKKVKKATETKASPAAATATFSTVFLAPNELELGKNTRIEIAVDEAADKVLAAKIFRDGQLVSVIAHESEDGSKPTLDAGNRRYRAAEWIISGFDLPKDEDGFPGASIFDPAFKLRVDLYPNLSPWQAFCKGVAENDRENLTPLQEAKLYEHVRSHFGKSDTDIRDLFGHGNYERIKDLKGLLELDPRVQELVGLGKLSVSAANQTPGLEQVSLDEFIELAASGKRVTAAVIGEAKAEAAAAKGEETDTEEAKVAPRNAAALKAFIDEYVLHKENRDSFNPETVALAKAVIVFLNGGKTAKALGNAFDAVGSK